MRYILLLTALLSSGVFASDFDETMVLAKQGDAKAQYKLGHWYADTKGDFVIGVKWIRKAAEQDHAEAQVMLGMLYDVGVTGIPENDAEAVKWIRKAAEQGHGDAQFMLGYMYEKGNGLPKDNIQSYVWLSMSKTQAESAKERPKTKERIRTIKEKMTRQQIAEAQALAAKCYESNYSDCD